MSTKFYNKLKMAENEKEVERAYKNEESKFLTMNSGIDKLFYLLLD